MKEPKYNIISFLPLIILLLLITLFSVTEGHYISQHVIIFFATIMTVIVTRQLYRYVTNRLKASPKTRDNYIVKNILGQKDISLFNTLLIVAIAAYFFFK